MIYIIEHWTGSDEWRPHICGDEFGHELTKDQAEAMAEEYQKFTGKPFRVVTYGRT